MTRLLILAAYVAFFPIVNWLGNLPVGPPVEPRVTGCLHSYNEHIICGKREDVLVQEAVTWTFYSNGSYTRSVCRERQ